MSNRVAKIRELYDAGISIYAIAKAFNLTESQVVTILGLYN